MTNTRVWKVERETETLRGFFHDPVGEVSRPAPVALYAKGMRLDDEPASKPREIK